VIASTTAPSCKHARGAVKASAICASNPRFTAQLVAPKNGIVRADEFRVAHRGFRGRDEQEDEHG
jgi:hypothetical protein